MSYRPQIAAEVRAELALKKLTVVQLSLATNIPTSRLHSRLSCRTAFDTDELAVIATVLGVSASGIIAHAEARAAAA